MIRPSFWLLLLPLLFLLSCAEPVDHQQGQAKENIPVPPLKRMSQEQYGINVGSHQIIQDSFPENQLLVDVLQTFGVERSVIDTIDNRTAAGFSARNMQAGHPYTILRSTESQDVEFFIYEETEENFVVIDLRNGVTISRGNQPVTTEIKSVYLPIISSLYEAARDKGVDVAMVKSLESIFANHVDFRHLDVGDFCKVIFEERYVDGAFIGLGQVRAAEFHQGDNKYQAFLFQANDSLSLYVDQYGQSLTMPFLPSPVDSAGLVSVEYNPSAGVYRFISTASQPVVALSSGKVGRIDSSKKNDFQLVLTHSDVTAFQYRSMGSISPGITVGLQVNQGDTLGLAGEFTADQSGVELSCWQKGEKTDGLPLSYSIPDKDHFEEDPAFLMTRKKMSRLLDKIDQGIL